MNPREVANYCRNIYRALKIYDKGLIFNMDETAWNFVYKRGEVLAEVLKEEVESQLLDYLKKCFTVISTISANCDKHLPLFFATVLTNRCEQQFDGIRR